MHKLSGNELAIAIENQELKAKLAKYESIVKTVDVDNLPDGEIISLHKHTGINKHKLFIGDHNEIVNQDREGWHIETPASLRDFKYIEQKDLMELFK